MSGQVKSTVYKKLQKARVDLQRMELKKSGKNTYSNFEYYELGDFLPAINELCVKHGIATTFSIKNKLEAPEYATLLVVNVENPNDMISFVCPTAEVKIGAKADGSGGAEPIQNLGGKITYMRRYMLMTAFEITESDQVDNAKAQANDELSKNDLKTILEAKNVKELKSICGKLKRTYPLEIINPFYTKRKKQLEKGK